MKFRTAGSGSANKAAETAATPNRSDGGKGVSSVSRNESAAPSNAVPLRPTVNTAETAFSTRESSRRSLEPLVSPSPRNGRPIGMKPMNTNLINEDTMNLAFQVPDTPPRNSGLGKHLLQNAKAFSLDEAEDAPKNASKSTVPFPFVEDDEARHQICQDSLIPWTYLLAIPGKNVRDILIDAFNDWLKVSPTNLAVIKQVVGYLHTGSLIIDDIEDESMTRRGEPAAHIVYGTARALNAGNYVYFLAMEKVLTLQSTECVMVFTSEMLNLHRGQGRDIFWRSTRYIATEEEYRHMVCDKTGGLFRLAIRFMQLLSSTSETRIARMTASSSFSECSVPGTPTTRLMSPSLYTATSDFTALADQMACYFQVRDDLINLASPKFHQKKGFCEDITEGKLSFIALHALRTYKAQNKTREIEELFEILMSKTEDKTKIKRALTLMNNTGAFDHTVAYLKKLHKDIEESINSFGKNPALSKLMTMIASEVDDCYDVKKRVIDV